MPHIAYVATRGEVVLTNNTLKDELKLKNQNWIRAEGFGESDCPVFFKKIFIKSKLKRATVLASAIGIYELYINGKKASDAYFAPGWTSYHNRIQYQSYDVAELLREGENEISIIAAPGWAVGYLGRGNTNHMFFDHISVTAAITVEYVDGNLDRYVTDKSWRVGSGEIVCSEFYHGEQQILGKPLELKGFAVEDTAPDTTLIPDEGCPVKEQERVTAVKLIITPKGERVIDFGQNLAGFTEIRIKGTKGDRVVISHAEVLDRKGNFYTKNLELARNVNAYVLSGEEDILKPHFSFQGYRYIRLDEYPFDEVDLSAFTSVAIYSEMQRTGDFICGNAKLNKLYGNTLWGQRSNFIDIPTDCPQRDERTGWTGDVQVFCRTSAINYDVDRFMRKWLRDVIIEQRPDGAVTSVVPGVSNRGERISTAWGDVCTVAPWELYLAYGDEDILRECFPMMVKWVNYMRKQGEEEYLWLGGEHYGDWLASDAILCPEVREGATQTDLIASAFFAYSTSILIKVGKILGEDMREYEGLYDNIKKTFRKFFIKDGLPTLYPKYDAFSTTRPVKGLTQTAITLVLRFGLYDGEEERQGLVDKLVSMIEENGGKMSSGFVGTPHILHALSENGRVDKAYDLLLCEENPSWLFSVNHGATTIWEHWDSIGDDGRFWNDNKNSFNHCAYGSVFDWVFGCALGINVSPEGAGYRKIIITPHPDKRLGFAAGSILTRQGRLRVRWTYEGDRIRYEIRIPKGTEATVRLDDGISRVCTTGNYCFEIEV